MRRSALATAALQQQVQHFGGEPHPFLGESSRAQAAVLTGEAGIEDVAAFEELVDPAVTESRRGGGRGSRGGRGRGSGSRENAADQGAQGARRGRGRGRGRDRGRGRGRKRAREELEEEMEEGE